MYGLFFDTETTGLAVFREPSVHPDQPKLVQLAALFVDLDARKEVASIDLIVTPESWTIPQEAAMVHGITTTLANEVGVNLDTAVFAFRDLIARSSIIVAHNIKFDKIVIERACAMVNIAYGQEVDDPFDGKKLICTMLNATNIVKAKSKRPMHNADYKWPKLEQCSQFFFGKGIEDAHSAIADVRVCKDVFFELVDRGAIILPSQ